MKNIVTAILLCLAMSNSHATIFDFSYTSGLNGTLSGKLSGTLQSDNNTVLVSSILDFVTLDAIFSPALPNINSTDFSNFGIFGLLPVVTIDGSYMDINACNGAVLTCNASGIDAFTFNAGNQTAANYHSGTPFYATDGYFGGSFGGFSTNFIAANWQLSIDTSPVPEPVSGLLWLVGSLGLGLSRLMRPKTLSA